MTDNRLQRRIIIDPAVADLLAGMEQKQADMALPRRERLKKKREQAKISARRDQRTTYDLPPSIRQKVKEIAEGEGIPASQIATLALAKLIIDYDEGKVDLGQYKQPSRSPRYDWNLIFPENLVAMPIKKEKRK